MIRPNRFLPVVLLAAASFLLIGADTPKPKEWSMNATIIEACSCPMFCQCYFNPKPSAHASSHAAHGEHDAEHYCKFNNAYKVNKGNYGTTKLDGAKFWIAGDLGADFSKRETNWAIVTFDPSVTPEQREGIATVLGHVYPVKWKSFNVAADAPVDWAITKEGAVAKLGGGKAGEVVLNNFRGMTDEPVVIRNLIYWGAPRNDGFVLMPNTIETYRLGDNAFEYKGSNGFMITFDINSNDIAKQQASSMGM